MNNPATPCFITLPGRGLITARGEEAFKFLQNLITNDLEKLAENKLLYACLLTPQGKFLHDFFISKKDDVFYLDCEGGTRADDLFRRLKIYKLRMKVDLDLQEARNVYITLPATGIYDDPRNAALGSRGFEKPDLTEMPLSIWDETRIRLAIADGSRDAEIEKSTLAETNMADSAVAYDKGCYIGQELTARMHFRGLAKKGLYPAILSGEVPDFAEARSRCGAYALLLIRHETASTLPRNQDAIICL